MDFVVIVFKAFLRQRFAACYVKMGSTYTVWSKVAKNSFFQKNCGEDYKDWATEGSFKIEGVYGEGIGKNLSKEDEKNMYLQK